MNDSSELIGVTTNAISNLRNFAYMNKLKKASLNVIASQLTDDGLRQLKDLFMSMDDNNDGTLSIGELKDGLQKAGVSLPPNIDHIWEQIDTDGSGVIDYTEFMAASMDKRKYMEEDVCWKAFKSLDMDSSGTLDREEIMRLLVGESVADLVQCELTEHEVDEIMKEVDLNGDGKIDFDEFMVMMRRIPQAQLIQLSNQKANKRSASKGSGASTKSPKKS